MWVPRPSIKEIALETGRTVGTIGSKISLMGLARSALRPETAETINGAPSKDDYSKPQTARARRLRPCIVDTCRRPFFSDGAHHRMCARCRLSTEVSDVYYA
jgi:hypothetical protein